MANYIQYDSDEAAAQKTVTGWVSSKGRFWGEDEHMARWDGCTHLKCECGNPHEKSWTMCRNCIDKKNNEKYATLPLVEWDETTPVCTYDGDTFFFSPDEVAEYCAAEEIAPEELRLVICEPQMAWIVEPDEYYSDILPEGQSIADISHEIYEAFSALNNVIEAHEKPISWVASNKRVSVKP